MCVFGPSWLALLLLLMALASRSRPIPTQAGRFRTNCADLRVVPVGRISYKFAIIYSSAIAGGFIKNKVINIIIIIIL